MYLNISEVKFFLLLLLKITCPGCIDITRAIKLSGLKPIVKVFNRGKGLWYYTLNLIKQENILKL